MRLNQTPLYLVSDILITTRRVREEPVVGFPQLQRWVTTSLDPFEDAFDEAIYDTKPIKIDKKGTSVAHSIEGSHRDLGGVFFPIKVNQPA